MSYDSASASFADLLNIFGSKDFCVMGSEEMELHTHESYN